MNEFIMSQNANYSGGTLANEALNGKNRKKKITWFFNVAILQRPNFNKEYHHDESLALCVSASKFSWPLIQVRRGQHAAIMKKADSVNKTSSDSF